MVKLFNLYYFLFIFIAIDILLILYFVLRKKSEKTKRVVLIAIAFSNFALHFLKLAFPPHLGGLPYSATGITFLNICAGTTLLMPWIYLIKKHNVLHDYIFFMGCCGGIAALVYPSEALNHAPFIFNTLRFYYCHISILIIPLLAMFLGLYRPKFKNVWAVMGLWYAHLGLIMLNDAFLNGVGGFNMTIQQFFDHDFRNASFIYGPPPDFMPVYNIMFDPFIPNFLKTDIFGIMSGGPFWFPLLWMFIPMCFYIPLAYAILTSPVWVKELLKKKREIKADAALEEIKRKA